MDFEALRKRQAETGSGCVTAMCDPPKPWVECSIEEKIERLHEQVKIEQANTRYFTRDLSRLSELGNDLIEHRHDAADGGVMIHIHHKHHPHPGYLAQAQDVAQSGFVGDPRDPSKVYF